MQPNKLTFLAFLLPLLLRNHVFADLDGTTKQPLLDINLLIQFISDFLQWDNNFITNFNGNNFFNHSISEVNSIIADIQDIVGKEDNQCTQQILLIVDGLLRRQKWALTMLDATAKPQSGLLYGNIMQIGNYDQCLSIDENVNDTKIFGQYCTAVINKNKDHKIQLLKDTIENLRSSYGICVPAVCEAHQLQRIIFDIEEEYGSQFHLHFHPDFCMSWKKPFRNLYTKNNIMAISIFGTVGILVVLSTTYDIWSTKKKKTIRSSNLLIAFSLYSNLKKLLNTKKSSESLTCLNGLRVISMIWIIMAHRYMYTMFLPLSNLMLVMNEWKDETFAMFILSASLCVDTFFFLSGLLVVYVFLNHKEKAKPFNLLMFYIHRILRLTPALGAVILFYTTLLIQTGSGPFWFIVYYFFQKPCEENWWSTLLYVQNYVTPMDTCVGQSWYLAVDTQLYFLSPIIIFSIIKWPKTTICGIVFVLCSSCTYVFYVSLVNKIGPTFYGVADELFKSVYGATHSRLSPWLLGTVFGYIVFKYKDKSISISKKIVTLLWLLALGVLVSLLYWHKRLSTFTEELVLESSLFNTVARPIWAFALSLIVFLCIKGYGGIINDFLSCRLFIVLSRLTYSMYLVHIMVIIYFMGHTTQPLHFSDRDNFHSFWGDFAFVLIISTIWSLTFEAPVGVIENVLFGKRESIQESKRNRNGVTDSVTTLTLDKGEEPYMINLSFHKEEYPTKTVIHKK